MDFVSKLETTLKRFGFDHWGLTPLSRPLTLPYYEQWLQDGHHADMTYLERHLPLKQNPEKFQPQARSAVVVARNYWPHPFPAARPLPLRTALYASGEDYHLAFKRELDSVARALKADFPGEEFLCFTDSAPLMERDLATAAGLGWVGKNSCVIHPLKGSLFFIGEILTSLRAEASAPLVADFCGTCDRCIKSCPTGAIESPKVLNARKCISYWTIEAKTTAPPDLREKFGDWFFGCDICQTVCPWNEKAFGKTQMQNLTAEVLPTEALIEELRFLLTSSNKKLAREYQNLPYLRARPTGLKRNALYIIGNRKLKQLATEVETCCVDGPLLEVAEWALNRLKES